MEYLVRSRPLENIVRAYSTVSASHLPIEQVLVNISVWDRSHVAQAALRLCIAEHELEFCLQPLVLWLYSVVSHNAMVELRTFSR